MKRYPEADETAIPPRKPKKTARILEGVFVVGSVNVLKLLVGRRPSDIIFLNIVTS
eukprot:m.336706 g.336706  ORF g.336706 m.336706 type:complete len:56 (-) comp17937_c0_seq1:110-277(-)